MDTDNTQDAAEPSPASAGCRPFPKVSPDRLLEILRMNCESGDILCGDAADEIERLRITALEEEAIRVAIEELCRRGAWHACEKLRGLLERLS